MSHFWRGFLSGLASPWPAAKRIFGGKPTQLCSRCLRPTTLSLSDPRTRERELAKAERYGYELIGCAGVVVGVDFQRQFVGEYFACQAVHYDQFADE